MTGIYWFRSVPDY